MTTKIPLLLVIGLILCGCQTSQQTDGTGGGRILTPQRVQAVSRLASYAACKAQLIRDPQSRPGMERIRTALGELVAARNWDVASVGTILAANGMGNLASNEGQLVLTALPLFVDTFSGLQADLKKVEYAQVVVEGVSDGFNMALGPGGRGGPGVDPILEQLEREARATR